MKRTQDLARTRGADAVSETSGLLSDRIRAALTEEIASGALPGGAPLDEQSIADRFSASRTPVREALRQLASSGVVEVRPRRGVFVANISPEMVMDMLETLAELDALCARLATYRSTPIERARILEVHELSREAVEKGDRPAYDKLNQRWHHLIYEATHNKFLVAQAQQVRTRVNGYRRSHLEREDRLSFSFDEHAAVMQAMAQGDGERAARMMRAHMLNGAKLRWLSGILTDGSGVNI